MKNVEDIFIRFDTMYERDGQTDRHRMIAKAALDASRGKKGEGSVLGIQQAIWSQIARKR